MPQMGVSVSEGTVTRWLKQEGETIAADEPLLEISTDKVDTEVPSPGTGIVAQILVQEGETVEVGTKLALITPEGAQAETPAEAPPEPATQDAAREAAAAASAPAEIPTPAPVAAAPPPPKPAPAPAPAAEPGVGETVEPVTPMRRGIADHMRRSLDTAAHVTSAIEVDMSRIVSIREKLKK